MPLSTPMLANMRAPNVSNFGSHTLRSQVIPQPLQRPNMDSISKEYHYFADMSSKSKSSKLAKHQPDDLKITLDEGTSLPFGPIYSLSQEELTALHKFIDENL